jgi:phosphatidylglycerophosphate synthase
MFDQSLRHTKAQLFAPLAVRFRQVNPLVLTLIGLVIGLAAALLAARALYLPALALWFLNRFIDGLDGEIARYHGRQSDLGGYLDMMADLVVYSLVPIALTTSTPSSTSYLALALLLSSFYVNVGSWMYLSALLEKRGHAGTTTSIVMPAGLIEGTETIAFYTAMLLFPAWLPWLFGAMALLVCVTIFQRIIWAVRHLDTSPVTSEGTT